MESFAAFKARILDLSLEEQGLEIKRRMKLEQYNPRKNCPHCYSEDRRDISLYEGEECFFCAECSAVWRPHEAEGRHVIDMDDHETYCFLETT